ncbi:NAAT family transporter [Treponema phagedenis]|uniref:UPF0056 membrane protein n=2 Tax=Treponema phagedenis TaxID=162 RepID=A0A0B7H0S9_TREPH|nr:MarC family protein [Treponema phagedenis]NVP25286.1 NAAT family transporter [Treponema phagedenis]QEJ96386.1 NAAT family transporter [Treponema phagedenis]QEJ97036.1 NAAT family transporter [Treponema phagedenis]QEK02318.1 NAAT family transporter [Treponema phagedenis]QEK05134.1 NAAT family transporter [Treponema phagedenis]
MTVWMQIWSTAVILIFVIDPIGNIPVLLSVLRSTPRERHSKIILREMLVGLILMILFLFFGRAFLMLFHLETDAIRIAGGVIFFVIGIRMIFPDHNAPLYAIDGEPFIVPIAIPLTAGPSVLATLVVMTESGSISRLMLFISLVVAWFISCAILLSAPYLYKLLKERGISALERLMGMLLLMLSVQMFIEGIRSILIPVLSNFTP